MITLEKQMSFPGVYPLSRLGRPEELLFFDIETTGFSGEKSALYLIGCAFYWGGSWRLIQWFANTRDSEREILRSFFEFLPRFSTLVHFNGDGFDIPYLLKRCRSLDLPYDFSGLCSVDIYKKIRPYKNLLGLGSLKQKALECFLGIHRIDRFSGGELIDVYEEYLASGDSRLLDMLILHNEEDLTGMSDILPILSYPDFFEQKFRLLEQRLSPPREPGGAPRLDVTCLGSVSLPLPVSRENEPFGLQAKGCLLTLSIRLAEGSLKHFYPNYKDYYYLVYEDQAIHKSVAEYVDKSARTRATAKNCYTRAEGLYLPQLTPLWKPYLQKEYRDKISYIPYREDFFRDEENLLTYLNHLLAFVLK